MTGLAACSSPSPSSDATEGTGTTEAATTAATSTVSNDSAPSVGADTSSSLDSTGDSDTTVGGTTGETTSADDTTTGETTTGETNGCEQIDFLFVVDNSGSMLEEQERLIAAAPSFVTEIETRLGASDSHIMVVDVDGWPFEACDVVCDPPPECVDDQGTCSILKCLEVCAPDFVCADFYPCEGFEHETCDEVLGAGVTETWGPNAAGVACDFASGGRYIDGSEPDMVTAFECAAAVGTASVVANELTMEAMVNAVTDGSAAGRCNEGFLRDDARLVVVFITDEEDGVEDSAGTPQAWHDALVAAKGGNEEDIVVLGVFGDGDLPAPQCANFRDGGARTSPRLRQFVNSWGDHGLFGSICAPDYAPAFEETIAVVEGLCAPR